MRSRIVPTGVGRSHLLLLAAGLGCISAGGPQVREGIDYGVDGQGVWVRGPWEVITPSVAIDDVIDQLCPAVMQLPDARGHDDGVEYCGLLYIGMDGKFYSSAPSRLQARGGANQSGSKTCSIPLRANDPAGVRALEADFHSHPWPGSPLASRGDTRAKHQRYSIRIQFDTTCRLLKFVPHLNEPVPAELYERVGRSWNLLRIIPLYNKETGVIDPPLEVP